MSELGLNTNKSAYNTEAGKKTSGYPATHTVKVGETLSSIAEKYFGDSSHYTEIFAANKSKSFSSPNALAAGQVLKLPQHLFKKEISVEAKPVISRDKSTISQQKQGISAPVIEFNSSQTPEYHTVKPGETLSSIAEKYFGDKGFYMEIFLENKGSEMPHPNSTLFVGQKIKLPQSIDGQKKNPYDSINTYNKENPLSYLTARESVPVKRETVKSTAKAEEDNIFEKLINTFFPDEEKHEVKPLGKPRVEPAETKKPEGTKNIILSDAIKVNRSFDIKPEVNLKNLRNDLDKWALGVADVLQEFNTTIKTGNGGNSINIDADYLKNLAGNFKNNKQATYDAFKSLFQDNLKMGFINTLWAIDDITHDIKNDPFYAKSKTEKKVVDLAGSSEEFRLGSDKLTYMGNLKSHGHRNIEVSVAKKTDFASSENKSAYKAENMIKELSKHFSSTGRLSDPVAFENDVYLLLENTSARKNLIEYFKLNSKENTDNLIAGIVSEGGVAKSQTEYNSYFAIGSVMVNRALGRNIRDAAEASAKGRDLNKLKPVTIKKIIYEPGQFAVTWHKVPGKTVTLFDYQVSMNNLYKAGKLKEGGNSHNGFSTANEAIKDLFAGMNKLSAEVNGKTEKGIGRSTADLFYFNQSRNDHYSESKSSAVKFTDVNSTHVFFKAWDKQAFFTHD